MSRVVSNGLPNCVASLHSVSSPLSCRSRIEGTEMPIASPSGIVDMLVVIGEAKIGC